MSTRELTIEEIKSMVDELSPKVTPEGVELYQNAIDRIHDLENSLDSEAEIIRSKLRDISINLTMLVDAVSISGQQIIDAIESKIDFIYHDIDSELLELKKEAESIWSKANTPRGRLIATSVVLIAIAIIEVLRM